MLWPCWLKEAIRIFGSFSLVVFVVPVPFAHFALCYVYSTTMHVVLTKLCHEIQGVPFFEYTRVSYDTVHMKIA
jgi:hypothetical protein